VDADHLEGLVPVLLLQVGEIGQDMDAVDAAVRPEVEERDPPLELAGEREGRSVLSQAKPAGSSGARGWAFMAT
jgi:hypothetical protein